VYRPFEPEPGIVAEEPRVRHHLDTWAGGHRRRAPHQERVGGGTPAFETFPQGPLLVRGKALVGVQDQYPFGVRVSQRLVPGRRKIIPPLVVKDAGTAGDGDRGRVVFRARVNDDRLVHDAADAPETSFKEF
jgi:hypothetical protein